MAQVTGQGTIWNLPNYWGNLFTADFLKTPFLTMIGGLTGGGMQTENFEFPCSSEYDFPAPIQPEITETDSLEAPDATQAIRTQVTNVTQIFHQAVKISYNKLANRGRLSGVNTAGVINNVADERAWQIDYNLKIIARNIEHTILNGLYAIASNAGVPNKTRGMLEACGLAGGTEIAAVGAALSKALFDELLRTMFDAGAMFMDPVIWCGAYQKGAIDDIYGYAPEDRNVGGINIKQIETSYGLIGVGQLHPFMPSTAILVADMSVVRPVTQPTPEKGNFFYEELAKTGASEDGQIFGMFGLDHGPAFAHGLISGLDNGT